MAEMERREKNQTQRHKRDREKIDTQIQRQNRYTETEKNRYTETQRQRIIQVSQPPPKVLQS